MKFAQPGGETFVAAIDLASADSIKQVATQVSKEFGRINILVNNAGITKDGVALRMKKEDWDSVISTNLTGAFLMCQQVPHGMMLELGRIANISSGVGEMGNPGQANYVASKAELIGRHPAEAYRPPRRCRGRRGVSSE